MHVLRVKFAAKPWTPHTKFVTCVIVSMFGLSGAALGDEVQTRMRAFCWELGRLLFALKSPAHPLKLVLKTPRFHGFALPGFYSREIAEKRFFFHIVLQDKNTGQQYWPIAMNRLVRADKERGSTLS